MTTEVRTIPALLDARAAASPAAIAYRDRKEVVTWGEFSDRVGGLAMALRELGVKPGDAVAVMGQTTGQWATADQAILAAGGVSVGIYSTLTPKQVGFILSDCGARVAFVGSSDELATLEQAREFAPNLDVIVSWASGGDYDTFLANGRSAAARHPDTLAEMKSSRSSSDTALLVYTSGTTGTPKGAMLSHGNCIFEIKCMEHLLPAGLHDDTTVSFLPMAHVAEHVLGFYGKVNTGMSTFYVGSLDATEVLEAVVRERPTVFGSVPRLFEKAYAKIQARVSDSNSRRQKIFGWADRTGRAMSRHEQDGTRAPVSLRMQHALADRLVFKKIRQAFGGRVKWFLSGAAPIDVEILEFFHAAGMLVLEAYGLTECTGIATINRLKDYRFGTVGPAIPGTELRIADDGEVLVRGPHVFQGYLNNPEATAEVLDSDGWLHTGDIGELADGKWLRITDRKKNIIVTSGGKNIAPAGIEALLTSEPILGPVLIVGDEKPYLTALVTLDTEEARTALGAPNATLGDLAQNPNIQQTVRKAFSRANTQLARYEQIKRFRILDKELTIANGEITPTLKLRRKVVSERFATEIGSLYEKAPERGVLEC